MSEWLFYSTMTRRQILEAHQLIAEGWVTMKQWVQTQAEINKAKRRVIYMRMARGWYPDLQIKRLNPRVVLVKDKTNEQTLQDRETDTGGD